MKYYEIISYDKGWFGLSKALRVHNILEDEEVTKAQSDMDRPAGALRYFVLELLDRSQDCFMTRHKGFSFYTWDEFKLSTIDPQESTEEAQ